MKIAMLYICTGKYEIFWDKFYETSKKYFYPSDEKEYYVFTDSKRIIEQKNPDVKVYYQAKSGWPYDTLLRYQWFCSVQDYINKCDFAYYVNANSEFLKTVDETVIPYPTKEKPYVLSIHPRFYDDKLGETFNPERNPISTACVPEGTPCRSHCGAFWGGTAEAVIKMCNELRDRTSKDLQNNFIAIWHDQSHLIKYATEVPHYNIENGLISYEEYADLDKAVLIFPAKSKFGGNDKLREVSTQEVIKHMPKKIYASLLKVLSIVHLDNVFRKVVHLGRKK